MQEKIELYLDTGMTQIETTKLLVKKVESSIEYLSYNIERYDAPVVMLLIYTDEDISDSLNRHMRLTDALKTVEINQAYFNFVFLPFTELEDSHFFILNEERYKLGKVKHYYYYDVLPPKVYNYYNLINSYLFKIIEGKKEKEEKSETP
ncbi:MAG: hypothetical protein ABFQ64_08865 [Campylobacterota bacterium]